MEWDLTYVVGLDDLTSLYNYSSPIEEMSGIVPQGIYSALSDAIL